MRLEEVWVDGAGLAIKSEKAIVRQLERKFSSYGIANSVARETVTGKSRPEVVTEATDRGRRASTEEASAMAIRLYPFLGLICFTCLAEKFAS